MTIIWSMVPEISSATDIIFCHSRPFFCTFTSSPVTTWKIKILKKWKNGDIVILHMCTINDNHMMYSSWDMKCEGQNFSVILERFLPFYSHNNPKNQNFEKLKKTPREIIILHKSTKNHDHILYGSWDMARNGCKCYCSF